MNKLFVVLAILFGTLGVHAASICDDPMGYTAVCNKMKNLRSHIMMIESQRDLMLLNYGYVANVSHSLSTTAAELVNELPLDLENHRPALQKIATKADEVSQLALAKDPQVFVTANNLRQNCASCHTTSDPSSGVKWDEVFKMDWSKIVQKCDMPGRNPFICKNMYAMVTNHGYISTAYMNKIENYSMINVVANEFARISSLLIDNNFLHDRMANIQEVRERAKEVALLAEKKDASALQKANEITSSCAGCHSFSVQTSPVKTNFQIWN